MKFRKKPVVVEAWQLDFGYWRQKPDWLLRAVNTGRAWVQGGPEPYLTIRTLEGDHRANPGDWVIRGIKGELYPCKPDIFAATYEPAA